MPCRVVRRVRVLPADGFRDERFEAPACCWCEPWACSSHLPLSSSWSSASASRGGPPSPPLSPLWPCACACAYEPRVDDVRYRLWVSSVTLSPPSPPSSTRSGSLRINASLVLTDRWNARAGLGAALDVETAGLDPLRVGCGGCGGAALPSSGPVVVFVANPRLLSRGRCVLCCDARVREWRGRGGRAPDSDPRLGTALDTLPLRMRELGVEPFVCALVLPLPPALFVGEAEWSSVLRLSSVFARWRRDVLAEAARVVSCPVRSRRTASR